jgi:hypothetical protein
MAPTAWQEEVEPRVHLVRSVHEHGERLGATLVAAHEPAGSGGLDLVVETLRRAIRATRLRMDTLQVEMDGSEKRIH